MTAWTDLTGAPAADFDAMLARVEAADEAEEGLRWSIAKALNVEGAWCGVCGFDDGIEGCSECRRTLLGYADAALAVVRGKGGGK